MPPTLGTQQASQDKGGSGNAQEWEDSAGGRTVDDEFYGEKQYQTGQRKGSADDFAPPAQDGSENDHSQPQKLKLDWDWLSEDVGQPAVGGHEEGEEADEKCPTDSREPVNGGDAWGS